MAEMLVLPLVALVCVVAPAAAASALPGDAARYLPQLRDEIRAQWPDLAPRAWVPALIEQESGWRLRARLKTAREEGCGLGQFTRAYSASGALRFDALAETRALDAGLAGWTWADCTRADFQLRAVLVKLRINDRQCQPLMASNRDAKLRGSDVQRRRRLGDQAHPDVLSAGRLQRAHLVRPPGAAVPTVSAAGRRLWRVLLRHQQPVSGPRGGPDAEIRGGHAVKPLIICAAALAAGAALFAAGWQANGWRKDAQLAALQNTHTKADLDGANEALTDLRSASAKIRQRADEFAGVQLTLATNLDAIQKELKNAPPLPADCRPDAGRLRLLSGAVDAAKQAAAAR